MLWIEVKSATSYLAPFPSLSKNEMPNTISILFNVGTSSRGFDVNNKGK